jgi:7-cyano-7-deazaguanine synthase
MNKRAVCIISGGMDSALSAKIAQVEGYEIIALHFNYGQRTQEKELECLHMCLLEMVFFFPSLLL